MQFTPVRIVHTAVNIAYTVYNAIQEPDKKQ